MKINRYRFYSNYSCYRKIEFMFSKIVTNFFFIHSQLGNNLSYPDDVDLKDLNEVQIASVNKAPSQSMKVGLSAAKIAVNLFHKLLLPQSIQLFCVDSIDDKKSMLNELKIIQYPINCFSISDLTYTSIFHSKNIILTIKFKIANTFFFYRL